MTIAFLSQASHRYTRAYIIALALYIGLTIFSVFFHAPNTDEGDSWVMARDTNFYEFIHYFAYAGHPPLWYLVLLPFARLGLPYETMAIINALISFAVAWLILFRSPFPIWLKILFVFSAGISFQYAVFARGYMLMILIMFLVAVFYPDRFNKPKRYGASLALLFNCEIFSIIPAAMLAVFFTLECFNQPGWLKRYLPALAITSLGALICLVSIWPPPNLSPVFVGMHIHYPHAFVRQIIIGFLSVDMPSDIAQTLPFLKGISDIQVLPEALAIAIFLLIFLWAGRTRWVFFLATWLGWFCFIFICKYAGWRWHGWLMPIFVMWTLWLAKDSDAFNLLPKTYHQLICTLLSVTLGIVFIFSDISALYFRQWDYEVPNSGSKDMAAYIHASGYEHYQISSLACWVTPGLAAYLPNTDFWIQGRGMKRTFIWNLANPRCNFNVVRVIPALHAQAARKNMVILATSALNPPRGTKLQLLHYSPGIFTPLFLYSFARKN